MGVTSATRIAQLGDLKIAYDEAGTGAPILLIMGLSLPRAAWFPQSGSLVDKFRVIRFDNRGVGESDSPEQAWSIQDMAFDTMRLLDHLQLEAAHIVGVSMGGMIAQELAFKEPQRVKTLTLMSTFIGGPNRVPTPIEVALAIYQFDDPEASESQLEALFGEKYLEENREAITNIAQYYNPADPRGMYYQLAASAQWLYDDSTAEGLSTITAKTLVLHGGQDQFAPVENAKRLSNAIVDSKLLIWPQAGHALAMQEAQGVNEAITQHCLTD